MIQQRTTEVNASEETIQTGSIGIRFLLAGEDSAGSVSAFEFLVPAGGRLAVPAHKNDAYEEILNGIEGILTWTVDGAPIEVGPGQALCIPRGAVHRFDNLGNEDVKQLAVKMKSPDGLYDQRHSISAGLFDSAWVPQWSDRYLVWQMRSI